MKKGKTPVLNADEARTLVGSIKIVKKTEDEEGAKTEEAALIGLRDLALIGVMVYVFCPGQYRSPDESARPFVQGRGADCDLSASPQLPDQIRLAM